VQWFFLRHKQQAVQCTQAALQQEGPLTQMDKGGCPAGCMAAAAQAAMHALDHPRRLQVEGDGEVAHQRRSAKTPSKTER
jgi:hypothetical protein